MTKAERILLQTLAEECVAVIAEVRSTDDRHARRIQEALQALEDEDKTNEARKP